MVDAVGGGNVDGAEVFGRDIFGEDEVGDAAAAEVVVIERGVVGGQERRPAFPPDGGVFGEVIDLAALLPADVDGAGGAGAEDAGFEAAAEVGEEELGVNGGLLGGPGGEGVEGGRLDGSVGAGVEDFTEDQRETEAGGDGERAGRCDAVDG